MENSNQYKESSLLFGLKGSLNMHEWTKELDDQLCQIVIRNQFNFDLVSLEINEEAKALHLDFGATNVYTNEKCRLRWCYLHLKRKQGKAIKYKSHKDSKKQERIRKGSESKQEEVKRVRFKEDQNSSHPQSKQKKGSKLIIQQVPGISEPERLLNEKKFEDITKLKLNSVNDIEKQLWKKNIVQERKNKDYLDVSNEDFSKNKSTSIDGQQIIPSNFNIFRDSLRVTSEQLLKTLNDNLPDMNLKELDQESEEEDDDEEVMPLDFRTALIEEENKVIIQAKPLKLKTDEEVFEESLKQGNKENQFDDIDAYLEAVKKEPFKDENVIMIDPDINIKEKFEQIDLLCNIEHRINNTFNAPIKTYEQIQAAQSIQRSQAPISTKHYDTDTDNEEKKTSDPDNKPSGVKVDNLDFNNILKQWGVTDLNKLIGTSSEDESKRIKPQPQSQPNNPQQRIGIIQSIMEENRREREKNDQPFSIDQMLSNLAQPDQSEEDSDVAPMSALVDTPTMEEVKQKEQKQIEKAIKLASSASEDEQSANERKKKNDEIFQIDTSSKQQSNQSKQAKQEEESQRKVVYYKGVKIQSDNEQEEKGQSQSDSGDSDYFNQQRKLIKQKLQGNKNAGKEFEKDDLQEEQQEEVYYEEEERQWDDDMEEFDQIRGVSLSAAQKLLEEEQKKARAEAEKIRQEQLKRQAEIIRVEQERKQRERDELMEKLKKQDEERKRRKKEEKERKDQEKEKERELMRIYTAEKLLREQEERERLKQMEEKKQKEEEWIKKQKEENERRKHGFEKSIKKLWNGSEIPCLFDSKIAYSKLLYSLPVALENAICNGEVESDDLTFRRYKSLIIPIDELLNGEPLFEIIEYFMRYSNLKQIHNTSSAPPYNNCFPFKCIGLTLTTAQPPFNKCSLSTVPPQSQNGTVYRVIALVFDTQDSPRTKSNFNETLKSINLSQIFKPSSCEQIQAKYEEFITTLAYNYFSLNKMKEFPFEINSAKFPLIEFTHPDEVKMDANSQTLNKIAFFLEFAIQDDIVPTTTKESWEFIRRYPAFYAQNPNDKSYTKLNSKNRVKSKYNQYKYENICIVFSDISYGQLSNDEDTYTKNKDSLQYFFKKAVIKNGLEICGFRMIYLDDEQQDLYQHLFNEKLITHIENPKKQAMVAVFIRGIEAINKVERIVGHFNPDIARKTKERSLRSFFGQDKQHNCVLKMFSTQKKNMDELTFWFGGRVYNDSLLQQVKGGLQSYQSSETIGTMYLLVPPKVELKYLLISPLVQSKDLGVILEKLASNGISILDIQRLDYANLQYDCANMQHLNKDNCFFKIRGNQYKLEVGYLLKLSRESLGSQIQKVLQQVNKILYHIDRTYGDLFYLTSSEKEFKTLKNILKKAQFKVNYFKDKEGESNTKTKDHILSHVQSSSNYDSDDTEQYKDITLYSHETGLPTDQLRKANALINQKPLANKKGQTILHQFETNTFLCFIKPSTQTMQAIGEIMNTIFKQGNFELLGVKMLKAKKQIYKQPVSQEVKNTVKCIAYKFNEMLTDYELRYKIYNFKALVLVLRGRNIDNTLDTFYDKERMKFINDFGIYTTQPQVVFLTNQVILSPLVDFFIKTKFIKLYNDFSICYQHLLDSQIFSYLITHNVQAIENEEAFSVAHITEIKEREHLMEQTRHQESMSQCVCIIKPNQQLNVAIRALKVIANNENFQLKVQNVQIKRYDQSQLILLYKHDIQNDESISEQGKVTLKEQYLNMFNNSLNPVIQILVQGEFAISKMHQLFGDKDPKLALKDTLRTFYGVDRFDNAFFISENFSESLIEKDFLFTEYEHPTSLLNSDKVKSIKLLSNVQVLAQSQQINSSISSSHFQELALIVISPSLVMSNEFVYILDDLNRQKFNICNMNKVNLDQDDLEFLFQDLAPKFFYLDVMWTFEFHKGPSFLIVVEKEKAINEVQSFIGKFEIKATSDFEKSKKKSSSFFMPTYGDEQTTLIQEYGSYIFSFPNQAQNQKKIVRYFSELPNSQHFTIEHQ